jgi:nitronate monooxygenase
MAPTDRLLDLRDLPRPLLGAPMAGGPSTPQLAAAVTIAGGLGFLAGGYRAADQLEDAIRDTSDRTTGPFGVNVFVPGDSTGCDPGALDAYRARIEPEAERLGMRLGSPTEDDDDYDRKIDVLVSTAPAVASFTFGVLALGVVRALRSAGVLVLITVTSSTDADRAVASGADGLVVQGPDAGGHRGTFAAAVAPDTRPLSDLLRHIRHEHPDVPLVATGGLASAEHVAHVLADGALAAQIGTALLLTDEAGTSAVHRAALTDPRFTETVVTRAFTGRPARALRNRFADAHHDAAPPCYPQVHQITAPLRAQAAAVGDPDTIHLWAGTQFTTAQRGPAADILRSLDPGRTTTTERTGP